MSNDFVNTANLEGQRCPFIQTYYILLENRTNQEFLNQKNTVLKNTHSLKYLSVNKISISYLGNKHFNSLEIRTKLFFIR